MSDWADAEDELAKELYFRGSDEMTDRIIKNDPLYLQGRSEALEEAAKFAYKMRFRSCWTAEAIADGIRGLK